MPGWRGGGGGIISGNEQYLSVRRIRCFGFAFGTWLLLVRNGNGSFKVKRHKKETAEPSQAAARCCL